MFDPQRRCLFRIPHLWTLLLPLAAMAEAGVPFYLMPGPNPHQQMVVHWYETQEAERALEVRAVGELDWRPQTASHHPWTPAEREVYVVTLDQLKPGQRYECRIAGTEEIFTFRAISDPALSTLRFAVGGDMRPEWRPSRFRDMCETVASFDPEFVVAGGDLAYCRGKPSAWPRWDLFLQTWFEWMRSSRGDLIPLVPVVGNHEVAGGYGADPTRAPHFYTLFALPNQSPIRSLDLGLIATLYLLDSGHTHPCDGAQLKWLEQALRSRRDRAFRCAIYHVPGTPPSKDGKRPASAVYQHWIPLFEQEDLDCAFEHHRHAMKRSKPLKQGQNHPRGTVYFGDGCWGVPPRTPSHDYGTDLYPYQEARNGVWLVDLSAKRMLVRAIDQQGQERDRLNMVPRAPFLPEARAALASESRAAEL